MLSTSKNLYVGKKKKGTFQHSSFLAGGATLAAGRLVVENGILKVTITRNLEQIRFNAVLIYEARRYLCRFKHVGF